jgi:Cu-Zn family superoxide dismutase
MNVLRRKQIVFSALAVAALSGAHAQQPGTQHQSAETGQTANTQQAGKTQPTATGQQPGKLLPPAETEAGKGRKSVTAHFVDTKGKQIGKAMLMDTPAGLLIQMDLAGLPPGEHGFHIHERGACEPKEGFKSAGEHFAPRKEAHGFFDEKGRHAGDMPNQIVSRDGKLQADVLNREVVLSAHSLLDKDGSALILHAKPDDYVTQPSGGSGDRIACAVIHAAGGQATAHAAGSSGQAGTGAGATTGRTAQQTGAR